MFVRIGQILSHEINLRVYEMAIWRIKRHSILLKDYVKISWFFCDLPNTEFKTNKHNFASVSINNILNIERLDSQGSDSATNSFL